MGDGAGGGGLAPATGADRTRAGARGWLAVAALVLAVACLVPPVSTLAGRYVLAETVQFACFAMVIPAWLVLGAPWRVLGLAGLRPPGRTPRPATPASHIRMSQTPAPVILLASDWRTGSPGPTAGTRRSCGR